MEAQTLQTEMTLLIVDDDPLLTEMVDKYMSKRGCRVLTAASGAEALQLVEREGDRLRIVITDMSMSPMGGLELAQQLMARAPGLPVILATGYDADQETARGLANVCSVVRKPYPMRGLYEQIQQVVGGQHEGR